MSEWRSGPTGPRPTHRLDLAVLAIIAALSFVVSHYAWSFGAELVGVDAPWYRGELDVMAGPLHALAVANKDPRGFFLLLLYAIRSVTGASSVEALRLGVALCALLNGCAAYLLASRHAGALVGALSAVLSVLAVQTTVGFFAGIYANWFALGLAGLYFHGLLGLMAGRRRGGIASVALSLLILVAHPWTWMLLMSSTALLLLLLWLESGAARARWLFFALVASAAIPATVFLTLLVLSPSSLYGARMGLGEGLGLFPKIEFSGVTALMKAISTTLETYVQSFMADPLQYALALLGVASLPRVNRGLALVMASWMTIPGLAMLLVAPTYQWRLIYALPLGLLSGMGLTTIVQLVRRLGGGSPGTTKAVIISTILAVVLAMLNHTLRALAHTIWMFPI